MALLANTANSGANKPIYDPATLVNASTATLIALTAFDTTNLRYTFTAPASGNVLVRLRCGVEGATTTPGIILGILQSTTVIAMQTGVGGPTQGTGITTSEWVQEALFTVTGLTPGNSYTWDAAYNVQYAIASSQIPYGGPNNTTQNNAWGGFVYEIMDCPNLNSSILYNPATAVQKTAFSSSALTALDTTNLRITFTPPASGNVLVRLRWVQDPQTNTYATVLGGILSGASVIGRAYPIGAILSTSTQGQPFGQEVSFMVTGLSGSQTWDAAYSVKKAELGKAVCYGGPNDANGADAYGGYLYEIWNV